MADKNGVDTASMPKTEPYTPIFDTGALPRAEPELIEPQPPAPMTAAGTHTASSIRMNCHHFSEK